jgi:probable rRNA maturation factor
MAGRKEADRPVGGGVEVTVRNLQRKNAVDRRRAEETARRALGLLGMENVQVSVVLVGDRRIRELNRTYRFKDRATDVLAFPQDGGPPLADHPPLLGDVVISVETAARQAARYRRPLERELDLLLVHGLLHLAGYDHLGTEAERKQMEAMQKKILKGW